MDEEERLELPDPGPLYSHRAFRYPAKFHPPVVDALLERYVPTEGLVLDNFCGSGTTLIEAAVSRRRSIGVDIDPVAVLVSQAKTRRYEVAQLEHEAEMVTKVVRELERDPDEYERRKFEDLTEGEFVQEVSGDGLWVPDVPKLDHWFRRYVTVDLARISAAVAAAEISDENRILFGLALASSIRNASNADPVPVSGLEVTSHMKRRDEAGRVINPGQIYRKSLFKVVRAVAEYSAAVTADVVPDVYLGDATDLPEAVPTVDAVLTSPPYHNAVDYYRRHLLEMYWLRLVESHSERLELLPKYIGKHRVAAKNPLLSEDWAPGALVESWHDRMQSVNAQRATDFRHYMMSMRRVFSELGRVTLEAAPVVMVVGESAWNGELIPTGDLLAEVASPWLNLDERLWYPIKNRYMSYARRNGANIAHEHVLVFR